MDKIINIYLASFVLLVFLSACRNEAKIASYQKINGSTMGTTYECTFQSSVDTKIAQHGVDSVLELVNAVASTYIPSSAISEFNNAEKVYCMEASSAISFHMNRLMRLSKEIHDITGGFFNPALMPLVNYWGFGYKKKKMRLNSSPKKIDSLLAFCDFNSINGKFIEQKNGEEYCMNKFHAETQLDFSAIAKGYGVDLVAQYLASLGSENYYVNIGGEVVVQGVNQKNNAWTLGINYPDTAARLTELFALIQLNTGGMASSGNYRNFFSKNDEYHGHTINPNTGLAIPSDLLSVTILAEDCATADAFATACMAMGYEKGRTMVELHPNLEGFFIFRNKKENVLAHYGTRDLMNKINVN